MIQIDNQKSFIEPLVPITKKSKGFEVNLDELKQAGMVIISGLIKDPITTKATASMMEKCSNNQPKPV